MEFLNVPFFAELRSSRRILLAGAGGGFDIFTGLPLYFGLRDAGAEVHLANVTFSDLRALYWAFRLPEVARRILYLEEMRATDDYVDICVAIARFRRMHRHIKEWVTLPM